MKRTIVLMTVLLASWTSVRAQEDEFERLELRVSSTGPEKSIVVDRGKRDRVEVGDIVLFHPREGGTYRGAVVQVDERSSVVESHDKDFVPEPGTKGEVLVPRARLAEPEEPGQPEPEPEAKTPETEPEHPPWENKDEEYSKDKPLLALVRPVRPEKRRKQMTGRAFVAGAFTKDATDDYKSSFFRAGTDILYENPFGYGGGLRFYGEIDYLTERNDIEGLDLLVQRFSYYRGGTRFDRTRWEAGRFLQHGMPEFGVLDGFEWTFRRPNGHRLGASVGALPEPDEDFDTGSDLQIAGYYEWVGGDREQLTITGGYQKTWHDGEPDRDLFVARVRALPKDGWDFHGSVWVDFYTGSDNLKGSGLEVTQALASLGRRWKTGGIVLSYRRLRFPEILRNGEFPPPLAAELANNRYDRVALDGWKAITARARMHAYASAFDDEEGVGGAAEGGLELEDFLLRHSRADLTVFASFAQFEDVGGIRASYGQSKGRGYWNVLYEISEHHLLDFDNDIDDLIQHRIRASIGSHRDSGWDFSVHGDAALYDTELSWSLGFHVQKRF